MVGTTGFEPATSRPPAVRATNCATPRSIPSFINSQIRQHKCPTAAREACDPSRKSKAVLANISHGRHCIKLHH